MTSKTVVITGAGVVSAAGVGREALREAVRQGRSHIKPITSFDVTDYSIRIGGWVEAFQPELYLDRKILVRTPRNTHFAFIAAVEALEGAGLNLESEDPRRMGGVMGTTCGGAEYAERAIMPLLTKGPKFISPFLPTAMLYNGALSQLSIKHNLQGITQTVVSEGAGGADAVRVATELLQDGELEAALVGGAEATIWPGWLRLLGTLNVHTNGDGDPKSAYRPFDRAHAGLVPGEGAGLLVLETEDHARQRGAKPLAEVAGFGVTFDATDALGFDPSGTWYAAAMKQAMRMASVRPDDIDVVVAEGRATPVADQAEAKAIELALEGAHPPVTCIKGVVGHTFSAAGALDAVCALDIMQDGCIPPIANFEEPGVEGELDFVRESARSADVRTVLLGARGIGGVNVALVLRRMDS